MSADLLREYFTGTNGDPWPAANWTQTWLTGAGSLADIQSNAGRLVAQDTTYGRIAYECDLGVLTDCGVLFSITRLNAGEQYHNICLRSDGVYSGDNTPQNCVFMQFQTTTEVHFYKRVAGTYTHLSTSPDPWTETLAKQWVRIEAEGTTFRIKWWIDGAGEPGWLMTGTATEAALASGKISVGHSSGASATARTATFDDLTVYQLSPSVQLRAAGAFAGNITDVTQAITAPACSAGDILICALINKNVTANAVTPPDGTWTAVIATEVNDCTTAADDHQYSLYWKRATGSGGAFTFSKASDDNLLFGGVIVAYRGALAEGDPLDATVAVRTETAGAADNVTFPAYDPVSTNNRVIYVAYYGNDLTTFAAAMSADTNPDCTIDCDVESALGNDCSIAFTSGTNDGSSVAGRTWASASTTDAGNTGVVFALVAQIPPVGDQLAIGQAVQRAAVR